MGNTLSWERVWYFTVQLMFWTDSGPGAPSVYMQWHCKTTKRKHTSTQSKLCSGSHGTDNAMQLRIHELQVHLLSQHPMGSEQTVVPDPFLRKGVIHTTIVKVGVAIMGLVWRSHDSLPKHRTGERVWCTLICTTTTRFLQANEITTNLISANARVKDTLINWRVKYCKCCRWPKKLTHGK